MVQDLQHDNPLRVLFLDVNAYFASVEQAERPELRNRPIAVVPVEADTTFVIAASYEAKRFGVKTGTRVAEAKKLCPDIELIRARPPLYVHYHKQIIEAVESVLPVEKICSIDEMRCRLLGKERDPAMAMELGYRIKSAIREKVSPAISCSIGVAPNSFLAKLATDLQKPDGMVIIQSEELPQRLEGLNLREFTGINWRMEARLRARGIFSSTDLIKKTPQELKIAFGGYHGERWWSMLRGHDVEFQTKEGQTLSHSHVLPPTLRHEEGCRNILLRLAHKASARLRANQIWATGMNVFVQGVKSWQTHLGLPPTQDSITITERILDAWKTHDFERPMSVGIVFTGLMQENELTPSLFDDTRTRSELSHAMDKINHKFGKNSIYLASLEGTKNHAGEKIAFNKTWLFSEGLGDNEWEPSTEEAV